MTGEGLHRQASASGLAPAHVELAKLLAEIAVEDYLREIESEAVQSHGEPHEDKP